MQTPPISIQLADCKLGHLYRIASRNLDLGVFDGDTGFIGIREKFHNLYLFTEYHADTGAPFGTVSPLEDLGPLPPEIEPRERLYHNAGEDWARRGEEIVPTIRRDKRKDEPQHGGRQGFVDLYADTGERLPDNEWPFFRENKALFQYLEEKERELARRKPEIGA